VSKIFAWTWKAIQEDCQLKTGRRKCPSQEHAKQKEHPENRMGFSQYSP